MIDPSCLTCSFGGGDCVHGEQSASEEEVEIARLRAALAKRERTIALMVSEIAQLKSNVEDLEAAVEFEEDRRSHE